MLWYNKYINRKKTENPTSKRYDVNKDISFDGSILAVCISDNSFIGCRRNSQKNGKPISQPDFQRNPDTTLTLSFTLLFLNCFSIIHLLFMHKIPVLYHCIVWVINKLQTNLIDIRKKVWYNISVLNSPYPQQLPVYFKSFFRIWTVFFPLLWRNRQTQGT